MKKIITLLFLTFVNFSFAQLSFQENASLLGVGISYGMASTFGGGISFCDFDNDGWDDITFSTTDNSEVLFFKNNSGTYTQVDLGINEIYRTKQVLWVDFDNDGDKDFFVTSIIGLNKFYRNDGNMIFTDITQTCGLFINNLYTSGASFGDIDNDGDLDIFISNNDTSTNNQRNYLYRNDNGFFLDITESAGIFTGSQFSFCAAFFDYNNDGYQDIYVANDRIVNINRLYKNNGDGTFTDVSIKSGAGISIDAMSTTIGDYNNDGWFDIYVTNTLSGNYHLRNNGDGTFTNVASDLGTSFYSIGWGAVFLDADNDADLDLYVSGMPDADDPQGRLPSAFYENQGDNTFLIPSNIGFENDKRISFSNAIGDIDNNGFPDIVVMNDVENIFLWKNTTSNSNNWLKVNLEGTTSNRDGIGSVIEISINGQKQYRYTLNGEGYLGQNSMTEFFGLGTATNIDYVKVTWLSGIVDVLYNVGVNQLLSLKEGENILSTSENLSNKFNIFPNPSKGVFYIDLNSIDLEQTLIVFDVFGRIVISERQLNEKQNIVNLNGMASGIYFFKVSTKNGINIKKVILN